MVAGGAVDLMKLGFDAEMGTKVEVAVGGESLEGLRDVIGSGDAEADADLGVGGARGGWEGLAEERTDAPPRRNDSASRPIKRNLRAGQVKGNESDYRFSSLSFAFSSDYGPRIAGSSGTGRRLRR